MKLEIQVYNTRNLRLSLGSDAVDVLELPGVYMYRLMREYMQMVSHWSLLTHSAIWRILSVLEVAANQLQSPELGLCGEAQRSTTHPRLQKCCTED